MKKQYYLLAFVLLILFSCSKENNLAIGDTFSKKITIDFDSLSQKNNDWHKFILEKSNELEVNFSKGTVKGNTYTITAKEYSKDDNPIIITLSSDVTGTYSFKLTYSKSSETLETFFENGQSIEFPELVVLPKWKSYIPYTIGLILVLSGLLFWYLNYKKKKNSFDTGYIQITLPKNEQIELDGKCEINLAKTLEIKDIFCTIYCEQDNKFEEDEEVEIKLARVEIDTDMKMTINGMETMSESTYLKDKDKVIILNSNNEELIQFQYNEF